MSFSNVNIGASAGDRSGDTLRTAFSKINQNFSQISLTSGNLVAGVYSVNNRSGNVVLTINDIPGAVTTGGVSAIVQSNLTNYATRSDLANLVPNVTAIGTQISTAITAENLPSVRSQVSALQASIYYRDVDVDNLKIGNVLLVNRINAVGSDIVSANAVMRSYVDYQNSVVTSAWTANAASQAVGISTLAANLNALPAQFASINSNVSSLTDLVFSRPWSGDVDSANAAIITANTAMRGYVDLINSMLTSNAAGQSTQIIAANTTMRGYVDAQLANNAVAIATNATAIAVLSTNQANNTANIAVLTANVAANTADIALKAPIAAPVFTGNVGISGNIVFRDGSYQSSAAQGSGLTSRSTIVATPTVLTQNVGGNINIAGYKGYALYSIATSANTTANVWVTVYSNVAARAADYSRSVATDPTPGTGVIAEVINVGNVTQFFTPAVYGFNNEATANTNVPLKVTVTSAATATVTVAVTMLKLEN